MKISIIVPVYNGAKYIRKCLDSILKQTYENFEIICINDGSKDNSLDILKEYEKKDDRIKIFSQKNKGIAKTRNRGMELAKGDYLMFIDNDDYMRDTYLKEYIEAAENKYDIVIGGYRRINSKGKVLNRQILNPKSEWSKYIVTAPWAKIYKKSFIEKIGVEFLDYVGEDIYFNLKCYNNSPIIKIIKSDSYVWFYNDESFSNTEKSKGTKNNIDIVKLFEFFKEATDISDKYVQYFLKRYLVWYLIFLSNNSSKESLKKEYEIMDKWLKNNNINKTINPLSSKLKGEKLKNRLAVLTFQISEKLNMTNLFFKLISRGRE
ncbi:MAG: glycosyltransferase family 2 protein [Bacilli bacterium]|nr:glycosyltransferase family 2 protein [Bacilli bacterium]